MKHNLRLAAVLSALCIATSPGWAADVPAANTPLPKPRVAAPSGNPPAGPGPGSMLNMPMMQEHMRQMQAQMEKIRQTTDPVEKERLMNEHLAAMQAQMKMMHGMMGARPPMGADGASMPAHVIDQRFRMLEQRLDALQQMMEQLAEVQKNASPSPKK